MLYHALADLVLVLHLAFIIFVVAGGLLALRWRRAPLVHIPAALWGVFVEVTGKVCPLTPLENTLRRAAGASGYSGGFVEHYLAPAIYPPALSHGVQLWLAAVVVLSNIGTYVFVWHRYRQARRNRPGRLADR